MREAFGRDATGRALLQHVVANGIGGLQSLCHVTAFECDLAIGGLCSAGGPYAGIAIGLQFERDRILVGFGLITSLLLCLADLL